MTLEMLALFTANDNSRYREQFKGQLRTMFDNILLGDDPEGMLKIAEDEFIRANQVWGLMNSPDGAA